MFESKIATIVFALASASVTVSQQVLFQRTGSQGTSFCYDYWAFCEDARGVGDIDGDGAADFIITRGFSCRIQLGCPLFCPASVPTSPWGVISGATGQVLLPADPRLRFLVGIGDTNDDGFDDMLSSGAQFTMLGPDGAREVPFPVPPNFFAAIVRLGDVDGDGRDDIAISWHNELALHRHDGSLIRRMDLPTPLRYEAVAAAGDVDADGFADLIVGVPDAPGGGAALVISGRGGRVIHELRALAPGQGFGRFASGIGDFDRDGFDDVFASSRTEGRAVSGRTGATIPLAHPLASVFVEGVGDIDGDGAPDLVASEPIPAGFRSVLLRGPQGTMMYSRNNVVIRGVGDTNFDGVDDFLEFNYVSPAFPMLAGNLRLMSFVPPSGSTRPGEWTTGVGCAGADGRLRRIDHRGAALLGGSVDVRLLAGPIGSIAVLHVGSASSIALDLIGAPSCELLSIPIVALSATTDVFGNASLDLGLPAGVAPLGHRFELQWAAQDLGANPLGVTLSGALTLRIGN